MISSFCQNWIAYIILCYRSNTVYFQIINVIDLSLIFSNTQFYIMLITCDLIFDLESESQYDFLIHITLWSSDWITGECIGSSHSDCHLVLLHQLILFGITFQCDDSVGSQTIRIHNIIHNGFDYCRCCCECSLSNRTRW